MSEGKGDGDGQMGGGVKVRFLRREGAEQVSEWTERTRRVGKAGKGRNPF